MAGIAYNVYATEISDRGEDGVRTIEEGNLSLMIGSLALSDEYMETSLLSGELLTKGSASHVGRTLDNPEVEDLGLDHQVVGIAGTLLQLGDVLAWEAGNDAVNEGSANVAVLVEPLLECCIVLAEVILPELDVLLDAILEVMSVEEDQLARHDDEALLGVAIEGLEATEEELCELAGIRRSWSIGELAVGIKSDTSLGGVGDDETDVRLIGQSHECSILAVWIEGAADDIHTVEGINGLAVLTALQVDVIEAVLAIEPLHHTTFDWLNDNNRSVEVGLLVHIPDDPINKCTEEVTFTKLDDFLGSHALGRGLLV